MKTRLDVDFDRMESDPQSDQLRAQYYGSLANSELFVLLAREVTETGGAFEPQLIEMDGQAYVLAFDHDERMGAFCDAPTPYGAMSGRALANALRDRDIGIGINLGVADSAMLIVPEAVTWIADMSAVGVGTSNAYFDELKAPDADEVLLEVLNARLAGVTGPNRAAYLVGAHRADEKTLLLILAGFPDEARAQVAGNIAEGLRFAGIESALDTVFVIAGSDMAERGARIGLTFDLHHEPEVKEIRAPGSDPDKPPILH